MLTGRNQTVTRRIEVNNNPRLGASRMPRAGASSSLDLQPWVGSHTRIGGLADWLAGRSLVQAPQQLPTLQTTRSKRHARKSTSGMRR
jgi:hypothetical protein